MAFSLQSRSGPLLVGLAVVALLASACTTTTATRGGVGTSRPDIDRPALSLKLDRDDITYMVADYLDRLEASRFWDDVQREPRPPVVAIWPIENQTSQHLDEQSLTILSSIETALVNTGAVQVVDRRNQEALAREVGIQQGAAYDPLYAQRLGRQIGAQFFVTGKITSVDERLEKTRRVQYSLFLQVIEIETGLIRFQNEVTRTKQLKG